MFLRICSLIRFAIFVLLVSWPITTPVTATETVDTIVSCINHQNGHGTEPSYGKNTNESFARRSRHVIKDSYYFINGNLGWHLTWLVLIDHSQTPVKAYETYGLEGTGGGAFGRRKIPATVVNALEACGVQYAGVWQGNPPWLEPSPDDSSSSSDR